MSSSSDNSLLSPMESAISVFDRPDFFGRFAKGSSYSWVWSAKANASSEFESEADANARLDPALVPSDMGFERNSWARAEALTLFLDLPASDSTGVTATLVSGVLYSLVPSRELSSTAAEVEYEGDRLFTGMATSRMERGVLRPVTSSVAPLLVLDGEGCRASRAELRLLMGAGSSEGIAFTSAMNP